MDSSVEDIQRPTLEGKSVGDWYLVHKLGEGGMSAVYLGYHTQQAYWAAIKLLHPELLRKTNTLKRFQREAETAAQLNHPNIIQFVESGFDPYHGHYLALELLEGLDLDEVMERKDALPLGKSFILRLFKQICPALHATHNAGIIHRDLKPSNIFLLPRPEGHFLAKILDFGIAKLQDDSRGDEKLTSTGMIVGTPHYLAPEQLVTKEGLTPAVDIYALGVLLYQMLTGGLPLEGNNIIEYALAVMQHTPPKLGTKRPEFADTALEALLERLLAKKPEQRPQTTLALHDELVAAFASLHDPMDVLARQQTIEAPVLPKEVPSAQSIQEAKEAFDRAEETGTLPPLDNTHDHLALQSKAKQPAASEDFDDNESTLMSLTPLTPNDLTIPGQEAVSPQAVEEIIGPVGYELSAEESAPTQALLTAVTDSQANAIDTVVPTHITFDSADDLGEQTLAAPLAHQNFTPLPSSLQTTPELARAVASSQNDGKIPAVATATQPTKLADAQANFLSRNKREPSRAAIPTVGTTKPTSQAGRQEIAAIRQPRAARAVSSSTLPSISNTASSSTQQGLPGRNTRTGRTRSPLLQPPEEKTKTSTNAPPMWLIIGLLLTVAMLLYVVLSR